MKKVEIIVGKTGAAQGEGRHLFWSKKVGDQVFAREAVANIEAHKGACFVSASATGTLCEILVESGDIVREGDVVGYIESE